MRVISPILLSFGLVKKMLSHDHCAVVLAPEGRI